LIIDPVATYAKSKPNALAVVDFETSKYWNWHSLDEAMSRVAHWLIAELGPASGKRVSTLAKNCDDLLILQFGCIRAGAIFVPFNWRLAAMEVSGLILDAEPSILFYGAEFSELLASVSEHSKLQSYLLSDLLLLTASHSASPTAQFARQEWNLPSTLLYTSGTSGKPKGVMLSEENAFWGATNFILGSAVSAQSVFLCDMPMFHVAGLFAAVRAPILVGGTLYISKGFDPAITLTRIADCALGITHYFSVPQMAQMMWNFPGFKPEMLQGLTFYATGGAPNPAAQVERFQRAGIPMQDGFGMTETCSNFSMPLTETATIISKAGSIGFPFISLQTRIVDELGNDVPSGVTGELWVKGPSVTMGYWNQPEKTAEAFSDGWFKTGDACVCDSDGYFFLVDRKKDMFISGGENVYPAEVEAALAKMPEIAESAVIGIPDDKWGEVGCAYIVPVVGQTLTREDVTKHCSSHLASFKVPKSFIFTDSIPRTSTGKAQKHILRNMISEA
jgi:fatty-acyl-CoA synthase